MKKKLQTIDQNVRKINGCYIVKKDNNIFMINQMNTSFRKNLIIYNGFFIAFRKMPTANIDHFTKTSKRAFVPKSFIKILNYALEMPGVIPIYVINGKNTTVFINKGLQGIKLLLPEDDINSVHVMSSNDFDIYFENYGKNISGNSYHFGKF